MGLDEILTGIKDYLTPISLFLITVVGIIDNSKKIAWKPLTKLLSWFGKMLNTEITAEVKKMSEQINDIKEHQIKELKEQQDMQEAYELNDFFNRHIRGEEMTREQYELAIAMYRRHLARGLNHVNVLHLEIIENYYKNHDWES